MFLQVTGTAGYDIYFYNVTNEFILVTAVRKTEVAVAVKSGMSG